MVTSAQATAEIFLTALRALPKKQRDVVLAHIADDRQLGHDLLDLAKLAERRDEPSRPFRQYLAEKTK